MPAPPAKIWNQLEEQLAEAKDEVRQPIQPVSRAARRSIPMLRVAALAVTILVMVGVGWLGYSNWHGHGEHDEFTIEFGNYLEKFRLDPAVAQQFLLAKYDGQSVDVQQAVHQVGYRPAVADGLPKGYSVDSTYVMKMPCCTCVQCLCKRSDGSTIAIFEHDDEETTEWFGDRPELSASCNGKRCSLVEVDDRIAASWKRDQRHITVVGIRDVAELTELAAWFDERKQVKLPQ